VALVDLQFHVVSAPSETVFADWVGCSESGLGFQGLGFKVSLQHAGFMIE
jgi:hypothetical protein